MRSEPLRIDGPATFSLDVLRLSALWVAAGAGFKLFAGSPNDLPPLVRELPLDDVLTFRLAIALETCIVLLAFFRPRLAWVPMALLYAAFIAVLAPLVAAGAESCGCFGSKITLAPWIMMAIDGTLLLALLASRPWRLPRMALQPWILLVLLAGAFVAPWQLFDAGKKLKPSARPTSVRTSASGAASIADPPATAGEPAVLEGGGALPAFYTFDPRDWIGQDFFSTDLAVLLGESAYEILDTCRLVLYRETCEHCAELLEELTLAPPATPLVLVRVPEPDTDPAAVVTHVKPLAVAELSLPELERGYGGLHTPASVEVGGFVVQGYEEHEDEHGHGAARPGARGAQVAAASPDEATAGEESAPALPAFYVLTPDDWIGAEVFETELAALLGEELYALPDTCHVVFYRQSCEHCAAHLEQLAAAPPQGALALVRVPDPGDSPATEVTKIKPAEHVHLELPMLERGYGGVDTPATMDVEGYLVTAYAVLPRD